MVSITNMPVPANVAKHVTSAGTNTMQYITVHETDNTNAGADASAHARLQINGNSREASWHITVDDKRAIRSFPDTAICWHAGAKAPRTSGNPRSIGVEICVNSDSNYRKAVENAASVVAQLMRAHGIPLTRVVQHNHWSGKNCPRNLRNGAKGVTWAQFLRMVSDEYNGKAGTASTTPPASPDSASLRYGRVLRYGDTGADVKRLQTDLTAIGIPVDTDGSFGPALETAVKLLQRRKNLDADGIAGPDTQKLITELLAAQTAQKPAAPKPAPEPETEDDEMDKQLSKTQQEDMRKFVKRAYDEGVFTTDHTAAVATMTRLQAFDLMLAYVARKK